MILASVSILLVLAFAEIAARFILEEQKSGLRPFEPYFVSGDFFLVHSEEELIAAKGGPESYGYRSTLATYIYTPEEPATVFDRSNFLFEDSLSRYDSGKVDEISRSKPESIRIFVVGGSAAQGWGASDKEATWHAALERKLRQSLDYPDIYIFNAAIGAFISTQERIAFDMAVAPRKPDITIVLDGFNDMYLPAIFGARPGDPYQVGRRYYQIYNSSVGKFLKNHSALVNFLFGRLAYKNLIGNSERTLSNQKEASILAEGIGNVYIANTEYLIERGSDEAPVLVFFQPWRDWARHDMGMRTRSRYFGFFMGISERIRKSFEGNNRFIDISSALNGTDKIKYFMDSVHFADEGHQIVADAMFPYVQREVKRLISKRKSSSPSPGDGK